MVYLRLAEVEVIAAIVFVLAALPTELLDGEAEVGEVGYIAGSQVFLQFLLDGGSGPEVLPRMLMGGLEDLREHLLCSRLLLELTVVTLNLPLVIAGEPVDAV